MTGDTANLKALLAHVAQGRSLSEGEAEAAFDIIMSGDATPSQMGAFLMAMRSNVAFTSAEVKSVPSWNWTPWRR